MNTFRRGREGPFLAESGRLRGEREGRLPLQSRPFHLPMAPNLSTYYKWVFTLETISKKWSGSAASTLKAAFIWPAGHPPMCRLQARP